jgi:CheY-like chemotaxis protein
MNGDPKKKILLVEDNDMFRDMVVEKVRAAGYSIDTLTSSATLNDVRDRKPDLLVIDIVAPKEIGLQFVEKIKKDEVLRNLPIVGVAKSEESILAAHARQIGIGAVIDKVIFQADDLLEKISRGLEDASGNVEKEVPKSNESPILSDGDTLGTVLLVEDDSLMREMFAGSLRAAGYVVTDVPDAETGLEELAAGRIPEVILLDLLLPGKSGFQFLAEIKRKEALAKIPVIVVSNLGGKGDIDRAMDLGAADFLIKANSTIDEIIKKTKEHIDKSRRTPTLPQSVL